MSLATRCGNCNTMFRVVQDQLRISEGWVRCGRCDAVFNALDALVDLDAPTANAPLPASSGTGVTEPETSQPFDRSVDGPDPSASDAREPEPPPPGPDPGDAPAIPDSTPDHDLAADRFDAAEPPPAAAPVEVRPDTDEPPPTVVAPAPMAPPRQPTFVRRAESDARWTTPAMRAALVGTALMLLALFGLQAGYHFRDELAAGSPTADRWLRSACARWDCRIEAPRRIRQVTLESSTLSPHPPQPGAVKLSLNLRNRGQTDLALPSVELTLTDLQGRLIARRVLTPADFRVDAPVIGRGAELPLDIVLGSTGPAINGYTVELFYP